MKGKDVLLSVALHLKLLLKKRSTWALLFVSFLILFLMLSGMEDAKEDKSRISIGVCDRDNSTLSELVCKELSDLPLYEVTYATEAELTRLLKQGKLSSVCVIKEGFEDLVQRGKAEHLITIYEPETGGALLLPDILAGVMMQDICLAKSYELLSAYMEQSGRAFSMSREEYRAYVEQTMTESGVSFSFDISYVLPETGEEHTGPAQSIVYQQAIFAVFAMLLGMLSIYSVLPFFDLCHGSMAKRLRTLPQRKTAWYVGSGIGAILVPLGFGIMSGICFPVKFTAFLICTIAYLCVIVCIMLVAACKIKSRMVYQMGMLAMMLVFGLFGFIRIVDGLFVPETWTAWIPNGWYVRMLTESLK